MGSPPGADAKYRMNLLLQEVRHRPWPVPRGPWIMAQSWHDLLFAHWPVEPHALRLLIPGGLELDTFHGRAWVGVVPFRMSGVRLRGTPALPWLSAFPELNVRTYVIAGGKPGVWFFSLDAGNPLAVLLARAWFGLPYFRARMRLVERHGWIEYRSRRSAPAAGAASLEARYRGTGARFGAPPGSLECWLTERYCLYAARGGSLFRGEIHHPPWRLEEAQAEFNENSVAGAAGIRLPGTPPLLHFARRQDMLAWGPERL